MVRVLKDIELDQITGAMTNAEHPGIAAAMAALRFLSCAPVGNMPTNIADQNGGLHSYSVENPGCSPAKN